VLATGRTTGGGPVMRASTRCFSRCSYRGRGRSCNTRAASIDCPDKNEVRVSIMLTARVPAALPPIGYARGEAAPGYAEPSDDPVVEYDEDVLAALEQRLTSHERIDAVETHSQNKKRVPRTPARLSKERLAEMIEEATVDAYDESEQATGWYTMFEQYLKLPFETKALGVAATVASIDLRGDGPQPGRVGHASSINCGLFFYSAPRALSIILVHSDALSVLEELRHREPRFHRIAVLAASDDILENVRLAVIDAVDAVVGDGQTLESGDVNRRHAAVFAYFPCKPRIVVD